MPEKLVVLTDEDYRWLVKFIKEQKKLRVNENLPKLLTEDDGHQAPEVYIALVPSGGIPAMSSPSYASGDTPGVALCAIYLLVSGSLIPAGFDLQEIYNLGDTAISGPSWISVKRDKYGTWLADTGGGGSCTQNEIWQIWMNPELLGGTFDLTFTASTSDTITIAYDDTAAEVATAFATHADLTSSDVSVSGGNLPYVTVTVEFIGNYASTAIGYPKIDATGLSDTPGTGTVGDLTSIGVIITRFQKGSPN